MAYTIRAGRRNVAISRPEKQLIAPGLSKAQLASYYLDVAPAMLPHVAGRPLNFERYPDGIEGHKIFQQHASSHFPSWIPTVEVAKAGGTVEHVMASGADTLVYLANQACITLHSWLSRADKLNVPDKLVFDLDPAAQTPAEIRRAARVIAAMLCELDLRPWAMTSGSRGYHLVVPLRREADFGAVRAFARDFAALATAREPRLFTIEQRKAKREDKILIDFLRNGYGHTSVAPYSVRALPGAPVAAPLHLGELSERTTRPDRWTVRNLLARLEHDGDPWRGMRRHGQSLRGARRQLDAALAAISPAERGVAAG